jgi:membrane protease YdiL (CAAX protease family)
MRDVVSISPTARMLIYTSFILLILTAVFALDYLNLYVGFAALGVGFIGIVGLVMGRRGGQTTDQLGSRHTDNVLKWFTISIAALVFLDAFVPDFFKVQFLGYVLPFNTVVNPSAFVNLGLTFTIASAVLEEALYRFGLINYVAKFTNSAGAAIFASATIFALSHVPAYGFNLPVLVILGGGGAIFSVAAIQSGDVLTTILAHSLNNFASWLVQGSLIVLTPSLISALSPTQQFMFIAQFVSFPALLAFIYTRRPLGGVNH